MQVYLKSFKVQIYMFIAFFLIGLNLVIQELWGANHSWIFLITLALLIGVMVIAFLIYKKSTDVAMELSNKLLSTSKIMLYSYFGVYLGQMLLGTIESIKTVPSNKLLLVVISGSVLMIIAIVGAVLQMITLKEQNHHLFKAE